MGLFLHGHSYESGSGVIHLLDLLAPSLVDEFFCAVACFDVSS